jgi:hypothetical protein
MVKHPSGQCRAINTNAGRVNKNWTAATLAVRAINENIVSCHKVETGPACVVLGDCRLREDAPPVCLSRSAAKLLTRILDGP